MTTVQSVFDKAVALMDEVSDAGLTDWGDTQEYKNKTLYILNILRGELYPLSDTFKVTEAGKRPVSAELMAMTDVIDLDDVVAQTILPYGLAAHLLIDENPAAAGFFQQRYEELMRKLGAQIPAQWEMIEDKYGIIDPVSFGRW